MQLQTYVQAALGRDTTILGLRLKPLSIGHYQWLAYLGCAYANEQETSLTIEDLLVAVFVCHFSYEQFGRLIRDEVSTDLTDWNTYQEAYWRGTLKVKNGFRKLFRLPTKTLYEELRDSWYLSLIKHAKEHNVNVLECFAEFKEYMQLHSTVINTKTGKPLMVRQTQQNGGSLASHWSVVLFNTLTDKLGFSPMEANNMSISKAMAHRFAMLEAEGAIGFLNIIEEMQHAGMPYEDIIKEMEAQNA